MCQQIFSLQVYYILWKYTYITTYLQVKQLHVFIPNYFIKKFWRDSQQVIIVQCIVNSIVDSNMTSFFRFVNKRAIYRLGIISLAHALVHVTDFPVVNVHVDELSSAQIWQYKLCATFSASVNINYRLPVKVYYRICTLRHIRIEIIHGSHNVLWVLALRLGIKY